MTSPLPTTTETPLARERRLYNELFTRLVDAILNRIFDLRPEKARNRMSYFTFLFLVSGFVISMIVSPGHSLPEWIDHIRNFFLYLFNPNIALDAASHGKNY